jgi:PTS system nitrogen regulatory IIA component
MKLGELVQPGAIIAELKSTDRAGAVRDLVQLLSDARLINQKSVDSVVKSIIARERTRGTTGFGKGVAAPHAKVEGLHQAVAAIGRTSRGIDFASLDGEPVYAVFLILSPADRPEEHLRAMDLVFRHLQQEKFRRFLRQSDNAEKIHELLKEADEKQVVG